VLRRLFTITILCQLSLPANAYESTLRDGYLIDWLTENLPQLDEPPLTEIVSDGSSAFRFYMDDRMVEPAYIVAIRVETFGGKRPALLTVKRGHLKRQGGVKKDLLSLELTTTSDLTEPELAEFRSVFNAMKICGAALDNSDDTGFDGYTYHFEYANAKRHCAAERWFPQNDPFDSMGKFLLDLARQQGQ
jgi:hypothetical protein